MKKYETPLLEMIAFAASETIANDYEEELDFNLTVSKTIDP